MNILVINEYAGSPIHGMGFRHYYLAEQWREHGVQATIVTASYSHLLRKMPAARATFNRENVKGVQYIWIKTLAGWQARDLIRVIKWFEFAAKILFLRRHLSGKPDVVISASLTPISFISAWICAKRWRAKVVFEVRDIWPRTLVEAGGASKWNPLVIFMRWCENFAIRNADLIVSNLPGYERHVRDMGHRRSIFFAPNGVSLREQVEAASHVSESISRVRESFVVGYVGTVGRVNALENLIAAMRMLRNHAHISAQITGGGGYRRDLEKIAEGCTNIRFIDHVAKAEVPGVLNECDALFIGWNDHALYRFGIAANKLFDYMYAGKPIVHAYSGDFDYVKKHECGISVPAESPRDLADAILALSKMPKSIRDAMGRNGREAVIKEFAYETIAPRYLAALRQVSEAARARA